MDNRNLLIFLTNNNHKLGSFERELHPNFGGVLQNVTQLEYSRVGVLRKYIHFILFNLD